MGGFRLHLCFPDPATNNWGLRGASVFACFPPAGIPGLSNLASSRSNVSFIYQLHPLTHFLRPQAGSSRLLGARGSSGPAPPAPPAPRIRRSFHTCGQQELRHLGPRPCGGEEGRRETRKFVPLTPRTGNNGEGVGVDRGQRGRGRDREPSAGTEPDLREGEPAFRSVCLAPKQSARAREEEAERENKTVQEGGDGGGTKPRRGKPSQREGQRAETAQERNRGAAGWRLGESGRESLGSRPNLLVPRGSGAPGSRAWGPHRAQWSLRPQERRWAALRRHRPTGGGRGKCEAPKRRRGAKLTFLAHAGAGCAELACRGTSDPRALTSRRRRGAGQGRARLGCAQHPEPLGFARVWQPA